MDYITNLDRIYYVYETWGSRATLFASLEDATAQYEKWMNELSEYDTETYIDPIEGEKYCHPESFPSRIWEVPPRTQNPDDWEDCHRFDSIRWGNPATQRR